MTIGRPEFCYSMLLLKFASVFDKRSMPTSSRAHICHQKMLQESVIAPLQGSLLMAVLREFTFLLCKENGQFCCFFEPFWLRFLRILVLSLSCTSLFSLVKFLLTHTHIHTQKERRLVKRVSTNHIIIKTTFAENITSFIACLRPKIIACNERLCEHRNFNPHERP